LAAITAAVEALLAREALLAHEALLAPGDLL